jgi:hypothetical protein
MSEPTPNHQTPEQNAGSQALQGQIQKLEVLSHRPLDSAVLARFDDETENLIKRLLGATHPQLEAYKYAKLAEAAEMVNLPESAQEESVQDLPRKAIQQRRQVLEGCLAELRSTKETEAAALSGEDHEDPPGMS